MKTLTVTLISLTIIRILVGDIPFMKIWWLDALLVGGLVLLVGIHSYAIYGVAKRRAATKQKRPRWEGAPEVQLIPEEDFRIQRARLAKDNPLRCLWVSRQSKVVLVRCAPWILLSIALWLLGIWLSARQVKLHPSLTLPWQENGEWQKHNIGFTIKVWEIPLLLSFRTAYSAVRGWQRWKWGRIWTVTEKAFTERREESKLFPEEGSEDTHWIPTDQITEVRAKISYWGNILGGYGTVFIEVRISTERDTVDRIETLYYVPKAEQFADALRSVSRAGGTAVSGFVEIAAPSGDASQRTLAALQSVRDAVKRQKVADESESPTREL